MTDADPYYWDIVNDDEKISDRPTQWEGQLEDGRDFAFAYEQGQAHLTINPGTPDYQTVSRAYGGDRANKLGYDEYHVLFVQLLREMEGKP